MQIINPNVELIEQNENIVSHVACCARVCYKREKGNDEVTYNNLLKNKHWSMFRHATRYYIVPKRCVPKWVDDYMNVITFNAKIVGIDIDYCLGIYYIVINGQWRLEHPGLISLIDKYTVDAKEFANANETSWNIMRYTVGGTSGPTECELLTTQLYEPIDSAKTISDLIPISTEYEWKAYSEVSVISEAEYQSATSKDLNLVKVYIDIPPSKELYDSKKQMYYREWAVKKEGRIDDYLLVKHWLQVGLIGTRP